MTNFLVAFVTLVPLTTTQALVIGGLRQPDIEINASAIWINSVIANKIDYTVFGDYVTDNTHLDSKPGNPTEPDWTDDTDVPILQKISIEPWRLELGERIVRAASTHDALAKCGSYLSLADYTWCRKAMPFEANPNYKGDYEHVHEYNFINNENLTNLQKAEDFTALSFGIAGADPWSEFMSGLYFLKTDLFDCYYKEEGAVFGPLVNNQHKGYSRENPCTTRKCYTEEYAYHKICLDDSSNVREGFTDTDGRRFESLLKWLEGRKPLSVFLKMDIEGSEWPALEKLLDNEEELAKIRTLDMEVHFNMETAVFENETDATTNIHFKHPEPTQKSLTHNVEIMERLAEKMAVTGSSIEHDLQNRVRFYKSIRKMKPKFQQHHIGYVSTKHGLKLNQYTISFVNRQLL